MAKKAMLGDDYPIFVGESKVGIENGIRVKEPTLQEALEMLWENSDKEAPVHVLEIELYGSNPIDMFRVIGTSH